jgi:uncharacterized protein with HEPN domain
MSERSDKLLLADIITSISRIQEYTKDFSLEDFLSAQMVIDAVIRNFEISGEAASRISPSFKTKHKSIPFRLIKDFRNRLIHFYFGVDHSIVWDIIHNELPALHTTLVKLHNTLPDNLFDTQ